MMQNRILKVGLTGGIGSGKSTVSGLMKSCGIPIVDADVIARKVLVKHPVILERIREDFGGEFFNDDGSLNRRKLGELIFSDGEKKLQYEEIIIPYIKEDIYNGFQEYDMNNEDICILDAPTLVESGMYKEMDVVIVVAVDEDTQIERVMARDGFSRAEALKRIRSQMSTDEKCKVADFVINNNGNFKNTEEQVYKVIEELQIIRGRKWSEQRKKELGN